MKLLSTGLLAVFALAAPFSVQDPDQAKPRGPQVDQPAPTFRVNDHQGRAVTVGGKSETWTVLAFYPKAATPG